MTATLVHSGSQSHASSATALTTNSPSATAGNKLILMVSWIDTGASIAQTLAAPAGWTSRGPATSAFNTAAVGLSVFEKIAAGGVESPVVAAPTGGFNLFANGIITEWSGMGAYDAASSSAVSTNNAAGSTTGVTIPNTGGLGASSSTAFTGLSLSCAAGLANAALAFSGGSWTTEASDQATNSSVGTILGHAAVASNAALGAVYTWTSDSSMFAYQGAIVVFNDAGAAAGNQFLSRNASSGGMVSMGGGMRG